MFDFLRVQNFKWGVQFTFNVNLKSFFLKIQYITHRVYGSIKRDKFVINVVFKKIPKWYYLKILQDDHLSNIKYS